jgi:hypothetical protein
LWNESAKEKETEGVEKMKLYQCFDWFNDPLRDRIWWPLPPDSHQSISLLTAAVRLSGRMDDCRTETDLKDAVEYCRSLVSCGVLTIEEWSAESERVELDMEKWAEGV